MAQIPLDKISVDTGTLMSGAGKMKEVMVDTAGMNLIPNLSDSSERLSQDLSQDHLERR